MRRVEPTALVPHSAEQMFALVDDVEAYPSFLPWCSNARVISRSTTTVEATLQVRKAAFSSEFTTRNTLQPPTAIAIDLVGGPFRHLEGGWSFQPITDQGCRVSLLLEFEFDSRVLELMFGPVFEDLCGSLVDAFTRRAESVYGHG